MMYIARYVFIVVLIAFLMLNCQILHAFQFKLTNALCESFDKTLMVILECRLRAISRNKTTLTALCNIFKPLNNAMVRFKMFKKENGFKPWLIDYTVDACQLLRKNNHPVAKVIMNAINGTHTFTHPCPYVGINGVRDFYYPNSLILPIPTGDYRLDFTWMVNNKTLAISKYSFSFVEGEQ